MTSVTVVALTVFSSTTVSGAQDGGNPDGDSLDGDSLDGDFLDGEDAVDDGRSPPPDLSGIPYTDAEDRFQSLDVYLPSEDGENRPAVVFVHGGGFRRGTKNTFRLEGDLARERGWVGFSINYRLDETPGHPAEMNDVLAAVAWVRENAGEYGVDPDRIALWGTSAGASLAALAGTYAAGPLTEGDRVMAVVGFSGPMELRAVHGARNAGTLEDYLGCSPTTCPDLYDDASATSHVSADDPAMFLAHSENEGIPVEVTEQLAELLEGEGVPVELEIVPGSLHARALSLRTEGLMEQAFDFLEARFALEPAASEPDTDSVDEPDEPEVPDADDDTTGDDPAVDEQPVPDATPDDAATVDPSSPGTGPDGDGDSSAGLIIGIIAAAAAAAAVAGTIVVRRRRA